MKYTMQDKARILRITTRTLQRWRTTKPELYAIIEASFKIREFAETRDALNQEIMDSLLANIPPS